MAKNQKSYTPEFKQQIVDLYNTGGYSYPQLERELCQRHLRWRRSEYYQRMGKTAFSHKNIRGRNRDP
ncbi:transposase [Lachnospiraceae bacterium OttesenSCG-928-D06]|nr:transposase [Lachnospiraceae bacterium OttesenSCG-928-D06]